MRVGRYTLCAELARGGLASVHLGAVHGDAGFRRVVAIKRLHAHYATDPAFFAMFSDEARLSARVRHPHVVTTLDVVQGGDELLVVMEYIPGCTASELIVACRAGDVMTPPSIAAAIVRDALRGLHAAHTALDADGQPLGIVHRDVSPQNVIVGTDGLARVLDFGVAKARARSYETEDGSVKGKSGYMAPEQLVGGSLDARTDVFGAGVLLWELLCCRRLFVGPKGEKAIAAVLTTEVKPPSSEVPTASSALDAVVMRALEREAPRRFSSAAEMANAIEAAGPVASPAEIASWQRCLAQTTLEHRAQMVRAAEGGGTLSSAVPALASERAAELTPATGPSAVAADSALIHEVTTTVKSSTRSPRPWVFVAGVSAIAIAMAGLWLSQASPRAETTGQRASRGAHESDAPDQEAARSDADAREPVPAESSVSMDATPAAASASSDASAAAGPPVAPPVSIPKQVVPAPPDCNPPYTIDGQGHKRYKRECLQ